MKKYHSDRIKDSIPLSLNFGNRSSSMKKFRKQSEEEKGKINTKKRISLPTSKFPKNNSHSRVSPDNRLPNNSSNSPLKNSKGFDFSINLRYELSNLEKELQEFYEKNVFKLAQKESAFIDYFKNLNNHMYNLGCRFPKWNKLLKLIVLLIGSPLESIFLQFQTIIQSHDNLEKEKCNIFEKYEIANKRINDMKAKSKISNSSNELQELFLQNIQIKNSLKRAKEVLKENAIKENMLTKLVYEIRKSGVDVDGIYENRIKTTESMNKSNIDQERILTQNSHFTKNRINTEFTDESESPLLKGNGFNLDLNNLNDDSFQKSSIEFQPKVFLNLGSIKDKNNIIGFHEEFMSKIDEFSQSWRQAAIREKRY